MRDNLKTIIIFVLVGVIILLVYNRTKDYFVQKDPMAERIKGILTEISPEAASRISVNKGDKSYTINKRDIYLCLKDEKGDYYNMNTLVYVSVHELAHVLCKSIDHTDEFNQIFESLLQRAQSLGYYNPNIQIPENYCEY